MITYLIYIMTALFLIMPSLIGPTNIPPWEAFKMQKPVIYSDLPGIKDVLKDAVLYIDPMSPDDIAESIEKIFNDKELQKRLIKNGNNLLSENVSKESFLKFFKIIGDFIKNSKKPGISKIL